MRYLVELWRDLRCRLGWHYWFSAGGWLAHDDQYCTNCWKSRDRWNR
jgi:hypothetical protein